MFMYRTKEEELKSKGYLLKTFDADERVAKEFAELKKKSGCFVVFAEYSTRIRGYHHYAVWFKRKISK